MLHSSSFRSSKNRTTVRSQNVLRLTRAALQTAYALSDDLGSSLAERLFTSPKRHPRPAREHAILESGRAFEIEVTLRAPRWNGAKTRVAAWRWGFGPTVLLVHGWEGRGAQLGAFIDALVAAGLSVVAFDAPAHGDSPGTRLYLTDHADAIVDVAAAVGPLHATIAHSFGAAALLLARARGGLDVARNVVISPNVLIADSVRSFATLLALDDLEREGLEHNLGQHSGVTVESLRLDRLVGAREGGLLVFHDREDREVPIKHADRLATAWPNTRLVATDGLGHRRILRDSTVIEATVAFASHGIQPPVSDLVRVVDGWLDGKHH
ncbi:MAG: alpha/beta fold hydrolase [Kofleriaceae bacterium]